MKKLLPVLIIGVAVALTTLLIVNRPRPEVKAPEERVTLVEVLVAKPQDMPFSVASQGTVEPRTQTTVVAEVSGRVVAVADNYVVGAFSGRAICCSAWMLPTTRCRCSNRAPIC